MEWEKKPHPSTAFISTIDIVFPMHACGPTIKDSVDVVALYFGGRLSQRAGLNLETIQKSASTTQLEAAATGNSQTYSSASSPQTSFHVLITRI
jgi:hypothetical protein